MSLLDKISPFERKDLLIAWLVLGVAFTLGINGGFALITDYQKITIEGLLITFLVSLIAVGLSFVLHELSHKFTAMRFGYWAEFRKSTQMLIIAVVVAAITGIVFAAPGKSGDSRSIISSSSNLMCRRRVFLRACPLEYSKRRIPVEDGRSAVTIIFENSSILFVRKGDGPGR